MVSVDTTPPKSREVPDSTANIATKSHGWSKQAKGRYKKLWKRATVVALERPVSGISVSAEWKELMDLIERREQAQEDVSNENPTSTLLHTETCPKVLMRQTKKRNNSNAEAAIMLDSTVVEGSDHRDILFHLLKQRNHEEAAESTTSLSPGKRKHASNDETCVRPIKLPHWVCLHNPVATQHMAVLEVHVQSTRQLQRLTEWIQDWMKTNDPQRAITIVPTRWFPNLHHPKCISHNFLYMQPPKQNHRHSHKQAKGQTKDTHKTITLSQVYQSLLILVASNTELVAEGYPTVQPLKEPDSIEGPSTNCALTLQRPCDMEYESALQFVREAQVSVVIGSDESKNDDTTLPPFVATNKGPEGTNRVNEMETANENLSNIGRVFALDCEMVQTKTGLELARVTLIQLMGVAQNGSKQQRDSPRLEVQTKVIWDQLVKPKHPVLDYLTTYSGMTAELLGGPDVVELEQVQAALVKTLTVKDIVIGHSLENDLIACRWSHPLVVDTALLFRPNDRARFKFSLRHLAGNLLNLEIQHRENSHCSEEDALAALQLAVTRAIEGPSFGVGVGDRRQSQYNCLVDFSRSQRDSKIVALGPSDWLQQHILTPPNSIHALTCDDIHHPNRKALVAWLTGKARRAQVAWAHWKISETMKRDEDNARKDYTDCSVDEGEFKCFIGGLLSKTAGMGVVTVVAIQVGFEATHKMTQERRVRMNPKSTMRWTDEEQQRWLRAIHSCRTGATVYISP